MADLREIKNTIFENDLLLPLAEALCLEEPHFEQHGKLLVAGLPERFYSTNKRAVQIRVMPSLSSAIRNRSDFDSSDIFDLVSYIEFDCRGIDIKKNLGKSVKFICKAVGIDTTTFEAKKKSLASPIKRLLGRAKRKTLKPNPPRPESLLETFYDYLPQNWHDEGLEWATMVEYGIRMDIDTNRIIIPFRNKNGLLIGTKGRLYNDSDVSDDCPKYLYLDRCNISIELFNLDKAMDAARDEGYIVLFEGEKSCMKAWQYGYKNTVAVSSGTLTDHQFRLIHTISENLKIIIAFDKDKQMEEITDMIAPYADKDHEIYCLYDRNDLLSGKDSPVDKGVDTFETLLAENCYLIN